MIIGTVQRCINISESKLMHWPKGGWENTSNHGSGGGYEIPRQVPSYQGLFFRGGGPGESGPKSGQGPSKKETQKQEIPTKSGETGSAYPHSMGGMAPGGGGGMCVLCNCSFWNIKDDV